MNSHALTATVHGIVIVIVAAAIGNVVATVTPAPARAASRDVTRVGTSRELRTALAAVRGAAANAATVTGGPSVVTSATAGPTSSKVKLRVSRSNANGDLKGSSNSVPSSNRGPNNPARNRHRLSRPRP